jgi:putative transposase
MLKVVAGEVAGAEASLGIDEICRAGAQRMLAVALEAEVETYIAEHMAELDALGHRLVVRNGHAVPRTVKTAAGAVVVEAPRVDDRRVDEESGGRRRFSSSILLPWCRRSPQVSAVLPLLYLHGLSTGDFVPALAEFFGDGTGLSAPVVARLSKTWQDEHEMFSSRSLADVDYVYCWVDGVHFKVRLGDDRRLCCLVVVGVRADGRKELVAVADGYRESTESWAELLRDCRRRGMRAPVLAVGDGALGFWAAVRDVFPETKEQRCWFHAAANIMNALPKSVQPAARRALAEVREAEDRSHAEVAVKAFADEFGVKWPKAAQKLTENEDALLAFYDFPAEHWVHLRTTNPIESSFSTVRLRTKVTKGAGSRAAGLAMAYKLLRCAEASWRAVNAPHLVALVRAGATFHRGVLVERAELSAEAAA